MHYYRMNYVDFYKWCKRVSENIRLANHFNNESIEYQDKHFEDYKEALIIRKQYRLLKCSLDESGKKILENIINNKLVNSSSYFDIFNLKKIFKNWCDILYPEGSYPFKKLDNRIIGERIKNKRINAGYNREELAGLLEISSKTLRDYELGKRSINYGILYIILQILELDLVDFL